MTRKFFRLCLFLFTTLILLSCSTSTPACPPPPPIIDWGPLASMNGQSNVDIELGRPYILERVRRMLENYLFSVIDPSLANQIVGELDTSQVSDALRNQFREHGFELSSQVAVIENQIGSEWTVDNSTQKYFIRKQNSILNIYQSGDSGAYVRSVDIKETPGANNVSMSVLIIRLEPWSRDQSGKINTLQRSYRLVLKITPHIITPALVQDPAHRRQLLCSSDPTCTDDQGALLTFDLQELYNISFSRAACASPDIYDQKIVPSIYESIKAQRPLKLPTASILNLLASAGGSAGINNLVDVNVSADGFLKIGLQYQVLQIDENGQQHDVATTHPFDRSTMLLSKYPGRDWVIDIDKSIISASVRARMMASLVASVPDGTLTSFVAVYSPGEIHVNGDASIPVIDACGGSATVTIDARNPMRLCKDTTGRSVIISWTNTTTSSGNVCVALSNFFEDIRNFWDSNVNVGYVSTLPGDVVLPILAIVNIPAGDNDIFYGTDLDLDDAFAIVGRSTMMDSIVTQPRPDIPSNCPGVP